MQIIFWGTPQFAVPSLNRLLAHPDFEVVGVVTQPDKRRGRGKQMMPSAVKQVAIDNGLPVWQPKRVKKDRETLTKLKAAADAFVVVAYGQILSPEILAMPQLGCINVHGSILPQYRGAAPIQWSLYHGDTETGVTTMLMDEGMDTGPMLLKAKSPIGLLDNAHQVGATLAEMGAELLIDTLVKLGEITPIPQDAATASYAPPIQKSDYVLDWSRSAKELHNQVRGFFPNCVTSFRNQALKITATVPVEETYWSELPSGYKQLAPWASSSQPGQSGEVVEVVKNGGPLVQTGEGLLLLREVQLAGKRSQSGWDWANGTRLSPGEVIG